LSGQVIERAVKIDNRILADFGDKSELLNSLRPIKDEDNAPKFGTPTYMRVVLPTPAVSITTVRTWSLSGSMRTPLENSQVPFSNSIAEVSEVFSINFLSGPLRNHPFVPLW
jgi:hypothetical protein